MGWFWSRAARHARRDAPVALVLLLSLGAQLAHTNVTRAQTVDVTRAQTVTKYFAALSSGDIDGALATFTPDAVYLTSFRSGVCLATSPCSDSSSIRAQLTAFQALGHFCSTLTSIEVAGTTVFGQAETRTDAYRAEGVDHILSSFVAQVPQDKIAALFFTRNLADPGSALEAAIAAGSQAPTAALPPPSTPCA